MLHRLSSLSITNFKSIQNETFELFDYTPLIGYNNAGKSNILYAIKWLLRKSVFSRDCFNNVANPIIIQGTISGINEDLLGKLAANHRNSITPYIADNEIKIKRIQNTPQDTAAAIRLLVRNPNFENEENEWISNPAGIDNALNVLFPEPIYIGAMENSEEDVSKSKSSSTIGKLLAEIIGPIEDIYGDNLRAVLDGLKHLLDCEGAQRAPELIAFDTQVNEKIDAFFPDVNIKLHVPTPELKEIFSKGTIKVYEHQSPNGRDVSSLGHGAQRSIQMALIRHLAELKKINHEHRSTTLLLIDEPELYLHPQAIEVIRDALKTLSKDDYQVVFSTHSAMMVTHEDVANTVLIRKNNLRGTHKRPSLRSAIPQIVNDAPSQMQLVFSLSNSTNILFSEKVILTEGATEERILPKLIEHLTNKSLGLHKYALVKQGGVTNTRKSMSVLEVMGLPTKSIVDLDYVFKQAVKDGLLNQDNEDLIACREGMQQLATANGIILEGGWPIKRGSSMSPAKAISLLANIDEMKTHINNLHEILKQNNIWVWRKGDIESHLGLASKSEAIWASFVNELQSAGLENMQLDIEEIKDCVNWLIQD